MLDLIDLRNNFSYYYDFYISGKEKSFAEAGRKYFSTPSNLNRSVTKLEKILNLKLINRNNTGFELTLDGKRLLKKLDDFFQKTDIFKLKDGTEKMDIVLTIGTTRNIADFTLPRYLIEFNKIYPNVKINILTDSATNLNEYLINHKIDILIDYLPHINSSEKYEFAIEPLSQYKTCFACSESYYKVVNDKINSLKDLIDYKLIIPGSSRRRQMLDELLQINRVELKPLLQMPDSRLMAEIVKANDFIGYFVEAELKDFDLKKLSLKETLPNNVIGMIYPKQTLNSVAQDFVNLVSIKLRSVS